MKTFLVPTDFSAAAQNAAFYAIHFAKVLEAKLTLCHAFIVPEVVPNQQGGWPLYDYSAMKESTIKQLEIFADKLKLALKAHPDSKNLVVPVIGYESEVGSVSDLIHNLTVDPKQNMVVMGMTGIGAVTRFFLGSISHQVVKHAKLPVLLVPSEARYVTMKRIAFATDFSDKDIEVIRCLAGLAGRYDADLVITHVKDEWENDEQHHKDEHLFLDKLITKINYPKFYMRNITDIDIDEGLERLSSEYKIDMVVMVHKKSSFLNRLLLGSHSQTLAKHIKIPLMVIPENLYPVF